MIFVTVGTHEQQFNRLIRTMDELKGSGVIDEEVIMQTGYSDYEPKHCTFQKLYTYEEMDRLVSEARIVITHGGPSSFFAPLQKGKTPIVVPRQKEYLEHVNDHQLVFARQVEERYHNIIVVEDIQTLEAVLRDYNQLAAQKVDGGESHNADFCRHFTDIAAFLDPEWNVEHRFEGKQHVFIVGAKGFTYGGYETFLNKLTEYHLEASDIQYHVACKANGPGMTHEEELEGMERLSDTEYLYHDAHCFKVRSLELGSAQAVLYDTRSLMYCIRYIRKHHIEHPVVYVLSSRVGPVMWYFAHRIHRLGGKYYNNPDGREMLRRKYAKWVRNYWAWSEHCMVKHSDLVICDSKSIEEIIRETYRKHQPKTTYIAYGAEVQPSSMADDDPMLLEWLRKNEVKPGQFYVSIGRMVEENNFEVMIREFMTSRTDKDYVIIANENPKLSAILEKKYHFSKDPRIKVVGTVYDQRLLKKIREIAYGYFHGHEVGGTNPSLLEALGSTKLNLVYRVSFNEEVGQDSVLYWTQEEGDMAAVIDRADHMSTEEIESLGSKAKQRIRGHYQWQQIAEAYRKVFTTD